MKITEIFESDSLFSFKPKLSPQEQEAADKKAAAIKRTEALLDEPDLKPPRRSLYKPSKPKQ